MQYKSFFIFIALLIISTSDASQQNKPRVLTVPAGERRTRDIIRDMDQRLQRMEEGINTINTQQKTILARHTVRPIGIGGAFLAVLSAGCLKDCLKGLLFSS